MNSLNKILISFFIIISVLFYGAWEFIQSEYVAGLITKSITQLTKDKLDTELEFERLRFELFPPGAFAEKVSIVSNTKKIKYSAYLGSLGVSFDFLDVFKTKFTLSNIYLNDGRVNIEKLGSYSKSKGTKNIKKESSFDIKKIITNINENIPVKLKRLTLNQIHLNLLDYQVTTEKALLILGKKKIGVNVQLRSFDLAKLGLYSEVVDNVELYGILETGGIKINNLVINKDFNKLEVRGKVDDYLDPRMMTVSLQGKLSGHIEDLHNYIKMNEVGRLEQGFLETSFNIKGEMKKYDGTLEVSGVNVITDFAYGEKLSIKSNFNEKRIVVTEFLLRNKSEKAMLVRPFEIYNWEKKKFVEENIYMSMENLKIQNALRFKKEIFKPLKAELSGEVEFSLNEKDFHFIVKDGSYAKNVELNVDGKKILGTELISLEKTRFDKWPSEFLMKIGFTIGNTKGTIDGIIKNDIVKFKGKNIALNLKELGPYSGLTILGDGKTDLDVFISERKSEVLLKSQLKSFEFEGFKLDKIKSALTFDFKKNSIRFSDVFGQSGDSDIYGAGEIFLEDLKVNADLKHKKLLWKDLKNIYAPIMDNVDFIPDTTYGNWTSQYKLSGKATIEDVQVAGRFSGKNNVLFDEGFDDVSFSYYLENQELSFLNIKALKSQGRLFGGYKFDIKSGDQQFWGNIVKIPLKEISHYKHLPLNVDGEINGIYKGYIKKDSKKGKVELSLSNTKIDNETVSDSYFLGTIENDEVEVSSTVLGKQIELFSKIDLKNQKSSKADLRFDIPNINTFLNVFTFVESSNQKVVGELKANSNLLFNTSDIMATDFNLNVKRLRLNKDDVSIDYENPKSEILVKNGEIEKWDLKIQGKKVYLTSQAEGNISQDLKIKTKAKLDASLFEIFNGFVLNSEGTIIGSVTNEIKAGKHEYKAKAISSDFSFSSALTPLTFSKGKLLLSFEDKTLYLKRLDAELNTGNLNLKGDIGFQNIIPEVNLFYRFNNAGIVLFKKSELVFSGNGTVRGKTFPYNLRGNLNIKEFNITNEITDFLGETGITEKDIEYLPKNTKKAVDQILNLDIDIVTDEPVKVINSMANIGFIGALKLTGGEKDPHLNGKLELSSQKNQIFFKNNIFSLSKGNIFFYRKNDFKNPELDFEASSIINDYSLSLRVFDFVENFKLDMNSEPSLSKSDILSLIAFGYTEDLSSNLSDAEKENITRTGVGSIIFDRFKINETLKNEFGLEVNLGTEITEDERSYLSFREGESSVGRVRSATKLEVKRQMTEEVDLSVSSTVGSSTGQKQTMNLNYNINDEVSIEGVYENRTDPEAEGNTDDTSIGADVKMKWSFK
jgi:translocation and assembly module TamB